MNSRYLHIPYVSTFLSMWAPVIFLYWIQLKRRASGPASDATSPSYYLLRLVFKLPSITGELWAGSSASQASVEPQGQRGCWESYRPPDINSSKSSRTRLSVEPVARRSSPPSVMTSLLSQQHINHLIDTIEMRLKGARNTDIRSQPYVMLSVGEGYWRSTCGAWSNN